MCEKTAFNPPSVRRPFGNYNHGLLVPPGASLLVTSGQLGIGRDDIVPPDDTRALARLIAEHGGTAKVTEIAGAGHDVWRTAFAHGPLWDWLFAQAASPTALRSAP
jgi:hypothetical protein